MELALGCDGPRPHRLIDVYHALRLQLFPVDWMVHFTRTGILVACGAGDALRVVDTIRVDDEMNVVGVRHGDGLRVVIPSDVGVWDAATRLVDDLGVGFVGGVRFPVRHACRRVFAARYAPRQSGTHGAPG